MIAGGEIARGDLLALGLYAALALFAWHPLSAALMTMAICGTSAVLTGSGGDLLELGVALVLVSATCAPAVILLHVALMSALSAYLVIAESTLVTNGVYGILACALVALLAGITARLFTAREEFLLDQRARIARAFAEISRLQQDRIADELHDGIAHDLTLLLFHARALPKQPDEQARQVSLTTIEDSASRALRSAQSLLAVMRDAPGRSPPRLRGSGARRRVESRGGTRADASGCRHPDARERVGGDDAPPASRGGSRGDHHGSGHEHRQARPGGDVRGHHGRGGRGSGHTGGTQQSFPRPSARRERVGRPRPGTCTGEARCPLRDLSLIHI